VENAPIPRAGFQTPPARVKKGENLLKVPCDIKGEATSSFPLFKGDGRGICGFKNTP
jgi:hypothetical protein